MTVSNLKSELSALLSEFSVPLYDAFSNEKISLEKVAGFLFTPTCKKTVEILNADGIHSWKRYTYEYKLEITGKGNIYETSLLIFKALSRDEGIKNAKISPLALSKITRLPSIEISFEIDETNFITFLKKKSDVIFSGLSAKGILEKLEESVEIFTPSVVLAGGEKHFENSVIHSRKITVFVKMYSPLAQNVCGTVCENQNTQTDITIGDTVYNTVRFEKAEVLESDGFSAILKLGFYIQEVL